MRGGDELVEKYIKYNITKYAFGFKGGGG